MSKRKLMLYAVAAGAFFALAPQDSVWAQETAYEVRGCGVNEA